MNIKDWRGIRNLVAAELKTDTTAAITWGTPFPVCAVSKLTKNTESSTASKHYSNRAALHRRSRGADEVSIDASGISDATRARVMGEVYDEALGMYVAGTPGVRLLALGYIIKDTNGVEWGVWRLKGAMSYPETEHNAEDDGTDSAGETLTYTGQQTVHKFKYRGKPAKAVRIPLAAFPGGEAAFFAQVQTPDTVAAALAGGDTPAAALYLYGTPSTSGNIGLRVGESVTMYDGAVLPPLPEWDKTKYPYAYVCKNPSADYHHAIYFTNIPVFVCYALEADKYTHLYQTETISYVKYRRPKDFTPDADDVWVYDYAYTDSDGLFDQSFVPIWANVDVERINRWRTNDTYPYIYEYEATGEIAIAASDPIPVSGIVDYIGDIPIYEVIK